MESIILKEIKSVFENSKTNSEAIDLIIKDRELVSMLIGFVIGIHEKNESSQK